MPFYAVIPLLLFVLMNKFYVLFSTILMKLFVVFVLVSVVVSCGQTLLQQGKYISILFNKTVYDSLVRLSKNSIDVDTQFGLPKTNFFKRNLSSTFPFYLIINHNNKCFHRLLQLFRLFLGNSMFKLVSIITIGIF